MPDTAPFVVASPRPVRDIETCWIPLSDGCRLAARIWLPADADVRPVPAILEYIPYRRRDGTVLRDRQMHHYFAGCGYAAVRVDMRGSGDSDGLLLDEYLPQEQADAVEAIAWLARQRWCSGSVGMMGLSWGGFNALQVAAHRPPALKAIITACSTDDRYADDCHWMGGCLLTNSIAWASAMFAYGALPPDPLVVGERWRSMWLERLAHNPLLIETWLRHQERDDYWRQGSVSEDYGAIAAAVYAVGGWADAYSNAIPRLMERLQCPRKGLIGPWAHAYPHAAEPGPAIGFLQEAVRWWDHWLKGADSGIMTEPMLRVWMQDSVPPSATYRTRPGRWVAEAEWPPRDRPALELALGPGRLLARPGESMALTIRSPLATGVTAGEWCPYGLEGELSVDQRPDDGRSLVFDTAPLDGTLEILGTPTAILELAADRSNAMVCVRLEDVAPDGASTLVSYGLLNLTHRHGHDRAVPVQPGKRMMVEVALNDVAHGFAAGRRIRLAVATSHFPTAWPSPELATVTLWTGGSRLQLPQRPAGLAHGLLEPFPDPAESDGDAVVIRRLSGRSRKLCEDPTTGALTVSVERERSDYFLPGIALDVAGEAQETYSLVEGDPTSVEVEARAKWRLARDGWSIRTDTTTMVTASATAFTITATLEAFEDDRMIFTRDWHEVVPRRGV